MKIYYQMIKPRSPVKQLDHYNIIFKIFKINIFHKSFIHVNL